MMNTLAKDFRESDIEFSAVTITSDVLKDSQNFLEDLRSKGRENGSKLQRKCFTICNLKVRKGNTRRET
jgi:hypothetical protein